MLLWLGLTVWFNGERGKPVVLLSAAGLLAAAVFFLSHTMILGRGFTETGLGWTFGGGWPGCRCRWRRLRGCWP